MFLKEMRIGRPTETDSVIEKPIKEPLFFTALLNNTKKISSPESECKMSITTSKNVQTRACMPNTNIVPWQPHICACN